LRISSCSPRRRAGEVAHDHRQDRRDREADQGQARVEHEHRGDDREDHRDVGEDREHPEGQGLAQGLDVAGAARQQAADRRLVVEAGRQAQHVAEDRPPQVVDRDVADALQRVHLDRRGEELGHDGAEEQHRREPQAERVAGGDVAVDRLLDQQRSQRADTAATTGIIARPIHSQRRCGRTYNQKRAAPRCRSAGPERRGLPSGGSAWTATGGLLVAVGLGVEAVLREQRGVGAALDDPAVGEHEDLVGVLEHARSGATRSPWSAAGGRRRRTPTARVVQLADRRDQLDLGALVDRAEHVVEQQQAGRRYSARASAVRWRWPPDSVTPRSPTTVSRPSGSARTSSDRHAAASTCVEQRVARRAAPARRGLSASPSSPRVWPLRSPCRRMLSRRVVENRNGSCGTTARPARRCSSGTAVTSTPSTSTDAGGGV
jgi:hypothetical protein